MSFICSLETLSMTLWMRDQGEFTYGNALRFQSLENSFVRTALGSCVLLQYRVVDGV